MESSNGEVTWELAESNSPAESNPPTKSITVSTPLQSISTKQALKNAFSCIVPDASFGTILAENGKVPSPAQPDVDSQSAASRTSRSTNLSKRSKRLSKSVGKARKAGYQTVKDWCSPDRKNSRSNTQPPIEPFRTTLKTPVPFVYPGQLADTCTRLEQMNAADPDGIPIYYRTAPQH